MSIHQAVFLILVTEAVVVKDLTKSRIEQRSTGGGGVVCLMIETVVPGSIPGVD